MKQDQDTNFVYRPKFKDSMDHWTVMNIMRQAKVLFAWSLILLLLINLGLVLRTIEIEEILELDHQVEFELSEDLLDFDEPPDSSESSGLLGTNLKKFVLQNVKPTSHAKVNRFVYLPDLYYFSSASIYLFLGDSSPPC